MKKLIVLEDSSRAGMGGGQRMTLVVCNILRSLFSLRFVDFTLSSGYIDGVKHDFPEDDIVIIGSGDVAKKRRYFAWVQALLTMPFTFLRDLKRIVNGIDTTNSVCYATNKRALLYAYLLNRKYKIPYIYHAHLVENRNAPYYPILRLLLNKAQAVICVSNTVMEGIDCTQKYLVYNPSLNNKGQKILKDKDNFVVAFVGTLIPIKGVEFFIEAAHQCPEDIEYRIYGDGPLKEELIKLSNGRVRFMGFVKDIIAEEYSDIDVLVVPTIIKEALSLVAVDAKSVGIPIVTTKPGGQAEIVEDGINGFHVPMKDAKAIAEKVIQLKKDHEAYQRMAKASFESSKLFEYSVFKEKIISVFKNYLS